MKSRLSPVVALLATLVMSVASAGCGIGDETYAPPDGPGPWILVDLYHSRKQNHEDYRLSKGDYAYQGDFAFYRAFEHLKTHGYKVRSIRQMPLSAERLRGFDVLFINLVDDSRPNFTAEERTAIRQWVKQGGGLFVIADHTNVYRSSERLNPLLEPMGIRVGYDTAVDYPPEYSVAGLAWIMVWDFDGDYLTRGVDMISMQTGAPLFSDYGIAHTSARSFADFWDKTDDTGYYGNWSYDDGEKRGPLDVVAAREYGKGRVVVTGDQNIFGDAWLYFGDNFEFMMNIFQWLAHEEDAAPLRATRPAGLNVGLDLAHDDFQVGRNGEDGYYPFYVNLNRDHEVTANGRLGIDPDDDALLLMDPTLDYDCPAIDRIRKFFEQGKTVVLSFEADAISAATIDLLRQLAPDFSVDVDGHHYPFATTDPRQLEHLAIAHSAGAHALASDQVDVDGLEVSSLPRGRQNSDGGLSAYLLAITSKWGNPFITARKGGDNVDVARHKAIGPGELVVFIQDGFWRNRTLGYSETTPPTEQNADAVQLEYRLLDYLKQASR